MKRRTNPHIVIDSADDKIVSVHRGAPDRSFEQAAAKARRMAEIQRRRFYVVAHPSVDRRFKRGAQVTKLFYAMGPYLAFDERGNWHRMNPSLSKPARDFISKKIPKLMEEGYPQKQSIAIAYSMARKKGYKVPRANANPKCKGKKSAPVGSPRQRSFCARMTGMLKKRTSPDVARDPDSCIRQALRRWKCKGYRKNPITLGTFAADVAGGMAFGLGAGVVERLVFRGRRRNPGTRRSIGGRRTRFIERAIMQLLDTDDTDLVREVENEAYRIVFGEWRRSMGDLDAREMTALIKEAASRVLRDIEANSGSRRRGRNPLLQTVGLTLNPGYRRRMKRRAGNPVDGWAVTQDGETLVNGLKTEIDAVKWMHKRHSYSIDYAVRNEGYDIVLVKGGKPIYSYKRDAKTWKKRRGNPLTRREAADTLRSARRDLQDASWSSIKERRFLSGRAVGKAWAAKLYGPDREDHPGAERVFRRGYRMGLRNPRAKANPKTTKIPFRDGQKVPIEKALAWAKSTGNRVLVRQLESAIRIYQQANQKPGCVTWKLIRMGDPKRLEMVTAMADYGKSGETVYRAPKGSKKGSHLYVHKWGEGSGKSRPVPLLAAAGGKALIMPLGKGQKATDWLRG